MVMAPAALALGLLWSAAADVVLGPRTRNGASLVNIAKLPLHTKGTLISRSWLMIAMICTENNLGWSIHELGTPIYQQLITRLVLSGFGKKPCFFFLPLEMWVSCEFCLQPVLGLRFCQTQYANFHLRLAVWGLLKSCKNSRSTIGFTAWFMRKWGFHCGSCGLSQHMGRKSKPGHDGNSQVPKWFASHTTEI